MDAVADLIESAFRLEGDRYASRMIREMRTFGRAGTIGWIFARLFLPPAAYPKGFVWEEEGKIVGNASLLPVDGYPKRWVLANVAVKPEMRRKGIGSALTLACVGLARKKGAKEIFLQVESDNQSAKVLYTSLGFRPLGSRTSWVRQLSQPLPANIDTGLARLREEGEWVSQMALAERQHPEGLVWPYPLSSSLFRRRRLERLLGYTQQRDWVWWEEGRLQGSLTARLASGRSSWRLVLIVSEEARGRIERPLLLAGMMGLIASRGSLALDYVSGVAREDLEELGFKQERSLTWMALRLDREVRTEG
jgi:ribosomal protein S18 acetylase RimI-like enzyme